MVLGYPWTQKSKWSCTGITRASQRACGVGEASSLGGERVHFSPGQKHPVSGQAGLPLVGWDSSSSSSQAYEGCFETLHVNSYGML